jgi:uncharacterized repeat protein (TIGR03803 family)
MINAQTKCRWAAAIVAAILMMVAVTIAAPAQTYSVVYTFQGGTDGSRPQSGLIVDTLGNLYGSTPFGGTSNAGTVFKIDSAANETILYRFTGGSDGGGPNGPLVRDSVGNLYGTTSAGGLGYGVLFELEPTGTETVLHNFGATQTDGKTPQAGLVRDSAGNLYGTTSAGGTKGFGVAFELDTAGNLTTLHNFGAFFGDGQSPFAPLVQDSSGNLYGTTQRGGTSDAGTVFKIDASGNESILHSFAITDGLAPDAPVILDTAGNLFGTTTQGGTHHDGVAFELDPSGNETVLHNFANGTDGAYPYGGLVLDATANYYGTALGGGKSANCPGNGCGVIYRLFHGGDTVLYTLTGGAQGSHPLSSLLVYKGSFYGTAQFGGDTSGSCSPSGCGVVFKFSVVP